MLCVTLSYSQAEHAACAEQRHRHRGNDAAWRSSTRKNVPLARLGVNTLWSTPLTDRSSSAYRRKREHGQGEGRQRWLDSCLWLRWVAQYGRHHLLEKACHTALVR